MWIGRGGGSSAVIPLGQVSGENKALETIDRLILNSPKILN